MSHRSSASRVADVAIVGGGLTGLTLACLLADGGVGVTLVEPRANPLAATHGYGLRTSSISPASQRVLMHIGAWQRVPPGLRTAYIAMRVWDAPGARPLLFDAADAGQEALGHIVDNNALLYALEQAVAQRPRISWRRPARLESLLVAGPEAELALDSGRINARLVVGADGSRSRVRQEVGIAVRERDFGQRALVAIVRCTGGHAHTAWQRFVPTGPVALLPLDADRCSLIWSTTPEHAELMQHAEAAQLEVALNAVMSPSMGPFTLDGPRASFPLHALEARSYVAPRAALVGDAAHTVHPLAGQGVNLGLLDAASLAETVVERHAIGRDIGLLTNLKPFERRCQGRNLAMGRALEGFHTVFGRRGPFASDLRSAALSLVDRSATAKRWFIRAASGDVGEMPEVVR